jgi:hypothetical protein
VSTSATADGGDDDDRGTPTSDTALPDAPAAADLPGVPATEGSDGE